MRNSESRLKASKSPDRQLYLGFANTMHNYGSDEPRDDLRNLPDLIAWLRKAGAITDRDARRLLQKASDRPQEATTTFKQAIALREAIYRIFSAAVKGAAPEVTDLAVFNSALSEALAHSRIAAMANGFVWEWRGEEKVSLERLLWPIVRSAANFLTSGEVARLKECAGKDCTWLFIDKSKNQTRRWCDMKGCGNRAKWRRHYERKRLAR